MSDIPEFEIGQEISATATFRNRDTGALADPTAVEWIVRTPAGVETVYTYPHAVISKTGTGVYVGRVRILERGIHTLRWNGTGAVVASIEGHVRGKKSNLEEPLP